MRNPCTNSGFPKHGESSGLEYNSLGLSLGLKPLTLRDSLVGGFLVLKG